MWRIAGWNAWAKQKVIPAVRATSATRSGDRSRRTPSSSRTSAEPHALDAARLPCLTTRRPAPATTSAAMVEMFTVLARSPPVPTTSTVGPGTSMRTAWASIASTRPVSSSTVSPLARSPTTKPATCTGVLSPLMMRSIAHAVSVARSGSRASRRCSRPGQVGSASGTSVTP